MNINLLGFSFINLFLWQAFLAISSKFVKEKDEVRFYADFEKKIYDEMNKIFIFTLFKRFESNQQPDFLSH